MNEDDSEQIAAMMARLGYSLVASESDADVVFLNTCSVRAKPEHKAKSKLGELRILKREKPDLIVAVCGCMAQKEGERIRKLAPFVDMIVGTANVSSIPSLLQEVGAGRGRGSALELPRCVEDELTLPGRVDRVSKLKAFVPIMYGCDNFCAYCVVPFTRGRERSRPAADILAEVEVLAAGGCKELTLLGQNVNSYGRAFAAPNPSHPEPVEGCSVGECTLRQAQGAKVRLESRDMPMDFPSLLRLLNGVAGIERIRFITSHPKDLSDDLIRTMAELPKVCEHIHLPVQSGSDVVLERMNRRYAAAQYMNRLAKLREAVPGIAVTTDLIAGFAAETEEDFQATLDLVAEARFDEAFMFAFSPMFGTAAASLPDQLPNPVKHERLLRLIELQNGITAEINQSQIGRVFEVLVESLSPRDPSKVTGLTRTNKTMNFPGGAELIGSTVGVRAVRPFIWGFAGETRNADERG